MRFKEIIYITEESLSGDLEQISKEVEGNPQKEAYASKFLLTLLNFTQNVLAKAKGKANQPAQSNLVAPPVNAVTPTAQPVATEGSIIEASANMAELGVDQIIAELNEQMNEICKTVANCDPIISAIKKKIAELKKTVQTAFKAGVASSEKETQQYFSNLEDVLKPLIKKVSSNDKIQKAVKSQLEGWFNNAVLRDKKISKQQMLDFLREAGDGHIIDMKSLVSVQNGNLMDFVNPNYKDIFMMFKDVIFDYKPGGSGANFGPSEVAITLLGNPAEKADVGDIRVDGIMYEIKGCSNSKGGRMNGKQVLKPTSGGSFIKDFFKEKLPRIDPMYKNVKGKKVHKFNWNPKGMTSLNNSLIEARYNRSMRNKILIMFLTRLWKHMITNHAEIKDFDSKIAAMVDMENGIINPQMAMLNSTKLLYQSYKLSDGETPEGSKNKLMNILVLNSQTLNFKIVRNDRDLAKVEIKGGVDWTDSNSSSSPQIYVA